MHMFVHSRVTRCWSLVPILSTHQYLPYIGAWSLVDYRWWYYLWYSIWLNLSIYYVKILLYILGIFWRNIKPYDICDIYHMKILPYILGKFLGKIEPFPNWEHFVVCFFLPVASKYRNLYNCFAKYCVKNSI